VIYHRKKSIRYSAEGYCLLGCDSMHFFYFGTNI